jgi:mono/diheme cytochrome c family protein
MRGRVVVLTGLLAAVGAPFSNASAQQPAGDSTSQRGFLARHCTACHNQRLKTAGLALDTLNLSSVGEHVTVWEKVVAKLRAGAMPPIGRPQPDDVSRTTFMTWLENELDRAAARSPNPGRPAAFHRLNRTEYQNAIRDLLGLELDVTRLLPGDDAAYGFDNVSDVLSISPARLDAYLSAARRISRLAVGDPSAPPEIATYAFGKMLLQEERMSEDLPFGSRGGAAVRHTFPLDGEYVLKLRFDGPSAATDRFEVRIDGVKVAEGAPRGRPSGDTADSGGVEVRVRAPAGAHTLGIVLLKRMVAAEGRFPAIFPWGNSGVFATTLGARQYLRVDNLEINGPFGATSVGDTPSRRTIFTCRPDRADQEPACAARILGTLARRAYRRPVDARDVDQLMATYRGARRDGRDFEGGVRAAVERLLVEFDFLYRSEIDPPSGAGPYRLSDTALASRLSFFLWSSIPDDELLQLAEQGRLRTPAVFETQVRRMLRDERAKALVASFGAQWLYLRNLRIVTPDLYEFPDWDDNLRQAMARETELFLESQLRGDRSVTELLSADYTFVNERLARHYGIAGVYGSHFRRVTLPAERRTGLLGHASLMTVTSFPNRTSPVVRGKWLLENMLGFEPPAPPPDVPDLPETARGEQARSMRERLEQHRRNPACASCHAVMDPLGFALEQYDAIGRWRTTEGGMPVDSTGAMPDGRAIAGPRGLRDLMLGPRQGEFVRTVTEKLMTYATGRGVEPFDKPAIRRIVREAASEEYRWSAIILGIAKSDAFQMRMAAGTQQPPPSGSGAGN